MPPADAELIRRIRQNDHAAFDLLFYRYKDHVYRFVFYLTENRTEADDLFQETWLRVVRYLPKSPVIRDFKAWLFTIAVNLHRDEIRKKQLRRIFFLEKSEKSESEGEELSQFDFGSAATIGDESNRVDISLALTGALKRLPVKQRRVFVLKEVEGFKHGEISEMLGVPVGTVKSLLHRAVKFLQIELKDFRNEKQSSVRKKQ